MCAHLFLCVFAHLISSFLSQWVRAAPHTYRDIMSVSLCHNYWVQHTNCRYTWKGELLHIHKCKDTETNTHLSTQTHKHTGSRNCFHAIIDLSVRLLHSQTDEENCTFVYAAVILSFCGRREGHIDIRQSTAEIHSHQQVVLLSCCVWAHYLRLQQPIRIWEVSQKHEVSLTCWVGADRNRVWICYCFASPFFVVLWKQFILSH